MKVIQLKNTKVKEDVTIKISEYEEIYTSNQHRKFYIKDDEDDVVCFQLNDIDIIIEALQELKANN